MPKRSSKKPRKNISQDVTNILVEAIGEPPFTTSHGEKNLAVVTTGRLEKLKGGKATAAHLSPKKRAKSAKTAAKKRTGKPSR
jgi:hypothetical protein